MGKVALITGIAGFIMSHVGNHLREKYPDWSIVGIDAETPSSDLTRIKYPLYNPFIYSPSDFPHLRSGIIYYKGDLSDPNLYTSLNRIFVANLKSKPDIIIHGSAESNVDFSLKDPTIFWKSNVLGTQMLMEQLRNWELRGSRLINISTDEILAGGGTLDQQIPFDEDSPINASSPYSNSKAAQELVVDSYAKSFGFSNTVSVRCVNNYGPGQKEKLVPTAIAAALSGKAIQVYGTGQEHKRDWLYVQDFVEALELLMFNDITGHINVSAGDEHTNIDVVRKIISMVGNPAASIAHIEDPRGGCHDKRYWINSSRFRNLTGWYPKVSFTEGINKTIGWTMSNYENNS